MFAEAYGWTAAQTLDGHTHDELLAIIRARNERISSERRPVPSGNVLPMDTENDFAMMASIGLPVEVK